MSTPHSHNGDLETGIMSGIIEADSVIAVLTFGEKVEWRIVRDCPFRTCR
jgi:hypothetical protein